MMRKRLSLMLLLCLFGFVIPPAVTPTGRGETGVVALPEQERLVGIVTHARSIIDDPSLFRNYLQTLAEKRDFSALRAISLSKMPSCEWAAKVYVLAQNPEGAIEFCRQLPLDSWPWIIAFQTLSHFPKEAIIGYVKEMAANPNPYARYACYKLCAGTRWDDVADYAEQDIGNDAYLGIQNVPGDLVLGWVARSYLQLIGRIALGPPCFPPTIKGITPNKSINWDDRETLRWP